MRSYETQGRAQAEDPCLLRTPFQRDRDRIVHSKAFRRLAHKTQVFIDPEGDHFRTRLTHTLETTGIARAVARALRLNEELTEAIGLGHDLGHTPFGHAGEKALDAVLQRGVRAPLPPQRALAAGGGRARARRTRAQPDRRGARRHPQPHRARTEPATLEGRIVRLVDRVAYINHDIDDAIRYGAVSAGDLPREEIAVLGDSGSRRIDRLVHDIVESSSEAGDIRQSDEVAEAMLSLRRLHVRARLPVRAHRAPRTSAPCWSCARSSATCSSIPRRSRRRRRRRAVESVTDYLAGMTDRFALALFDSI